jgi:hypothetical protein
MVAGDTERLRGIRMAELKEGITVILQVVL